MLADKEPLKPSLGARLNRLFWKTFFILGIGGVIVFSLYTYITLHYVYAHGERAGYLQKLSKRGWVFKTWEGELALVNLPGAMPEIFKFTIRNDETALLVEKHLGKRVVVKYNQHRGIPVRWFGDTTYFVTDAQPVVENITGPVGSSAK